MVLQGAGRDMAGRRRLTALFLAYWAVLRCTAHGGERRRVMEGQLHMDLARRRVGGGQVRLDAAAKVGSFMALLHVTAQ